jgi:hypothetical protein
VIDNYDLNFLISQITDPLFKVLESIFKDCPITVGLEELMLVYFNIFHHDPD